MTMRFKLTTVLIFIMLFHLSIYTMMSDNTTDRRQEIVDTISSQPVIEPQTENDPFKKYLQNPDQLDKNARGSISLETHKAVNSGDPFKDFLELQSRESGGFKVSPFEVIKPWVRSDSRELSCKPSANWVAVTRMWRSIYSNAR